MAGMAQVRCSDGSVLAVAPVPVLDRDGAAYELTPDLLLDGELFAFRSRDTDDLSTVGELRAWLRSERRFEPGVSGARGCWQLDRQVVLDAWGRVGTGVRAVLTGSEALALFQAVPGDATTPGRTQVADAGLGSPPGG